jgi:hypothetical protein
VEVNGGRSASRGAVWDGLCVAPNCCNNAHVLPDVEPCGLHGLLAWAQDASCSWIMQSAANWWRAGSVGQCIFCGLVHLMASLKVTCSGLGLYTDLLLPPLSFRRGLL